MAYTNFDGSLQAQPLRNLFLDPAMLRQMDNASLQVNPAERREPVIRSDRPWEAAMVNIFLTVREENGIIRMWYGALDKPDGHPTLAYAESKDGIHWDKPNLGIVDFHGSKENNLLGIPPEEGAVFQDPKGKPNEKYAVITNVQQQGQGVVRFVSPDGLHWRRSNDVMPFRADSQTVTFWDEQQGCYVLYTRGWDVAPGWNSRVRQVVRLTAHSLSEPLSIRPSGKGDNPTRNDDLPRIVDEMPTVLAIDDKDPAGTDIYNISAQPYLPDNRWYIGFPSFMKHSGKDISEGFLDVNFVGSRDGIHWERYDRVPYAARGPVGSDTGGMIYMGTGIVIRGDEIWQYGPAYQTNHGDKKKRREMGDGVIYRYVQRVDGFVSLDFNATEGKCTTVPVKVEGSSLLLNVNTGDHGLLRVALLDADGKPIPGFGADECDPVQINSTHAVVSWKGRHDLASLRGRSVQLDLVGSNAKLYSFYFD